MKNNQETRFERLETSFSKQAYESPRLKTAVFGKQDVVRTSGTYTQETFSGGDTYGNDYGSWN